MKLYIGNKNYSSWSMRPWVLMRQAQIPFDEVKLRFDSFDPGSRFKTEVAQVSPTGRVPVLVDREVTVWDTLAIAEYLAEKFPDHHLWPQERAARAQARSVCAEMHSGFGELRKHCQMNIEASLPETGARLLREHDGLRADLDRVTSLWSGLLDDHGGPLLFGAFTIADAFFAPVVTRLRTYALPVREDVAAEIAAYMDRVVALPGVAAWIDDALAEKDFVAFEEPYRASPVRSGTGSNAGHLAPTIGKDVPPSSNS